MTTASSPPPRELAGPRRRCWPWRSACASCVVAHVVGEGAAAAHALGHHHLDAEPGQQADGGLVDLWCDHLLGAAGQQRHPGAALAAAAASTCGRSTGRGAGTERGASASIARSSAGSRPANGRASAGTDQRQAEPGRVGQRALQQPAHAAGRAGAGGNAPRCRPGRGRPGACSARPDGQVVMQDRQDRQRSMCLTVSAVGAPPLSSICFIR